MNAASSPVVIAAGGTGGHLFPAEALAQELVRRGHRVVLITDERGAAYAERFPASEIIGVHAATFADRGLLGRIAALGQIAAGIISARGHLRRLAPLVVIGFGGYPSLPAMTAALLLGLPTCIHEQNAVLGRVNHVLARFVTAIASTFPELAPLPRSARRKLRVTGNPLRDAVIARAGAPYAPPGALDPIRLLVFGGSQGARIFADVVPMALAELAPSLRRRLNVVQQVREMDQARVSEAYSEARIAARLAPFFADLPEHMAAAHMVIGRGGASTVCELAAIGRPALIVPLAIAMDDHQSANARALEDVGAAIVMPESSFTPESLAARLGAWLSSPDTLTRAAGAARGLGRPEATRALADLVEELGARRRLRRKDSAVKEARPQTTANLCVAEVRP
jgi:UDP-N-acetylglucosamine--N-acetylmuramyl-(pentapeptide) pyrophosphoryl-undecaprenol N-acetylglucosamine transferase